MIRPIPRVLDGRPPLVFLRTQEPTHGGALRERCAQNSHPRTHFRFCNAVQLDASPSDYYACWTDIGAGKLDFSMYACNIKTQREIQMITGNWSDLAEDY